MGVWKDQIQYMKDTQDAEELNGDDGYVNLLRAGTLHVTVVEST